MKILLHPLKKFFIVLLLLTFSGNAVFGQSLGDYRSVATGDWKALSSWQYYNGSAWVNPSGTSPQGYPGQYVGTGVVLIQAAHTISIDNTGISTQPMGTITISGSLFLTGINTGSTGTDFIFNTQTIIVTPLLGTITFIDKVNLKLPTNATLQVIKDVTLNPDYYGLIGDCNHNQDIYIGNSAYAYCNGGGSTALTFDEVMSGGGTLNAIATSNSPICQGSTINLSGSYTGATGIGLAYSWSITNPNNIVTTTSAQNPTISNAILGTYTITLICSTTYNSYTYSNSETISVIVNALPDNTMSSGFSGGSFCTGSQATLTFDANDTNGAPPYTLSYSDGTTTFSQVISTNAATTFNVAATNSTGYTLNSITNANGCVNLSPTNKTANVTFRPTPTATVSGTTAACLGATSPNITFTNPQSAGITINYTINGGANQVVSVVASGSTTVSVPTTTAGSFVYALVSIVYSTNPTCMQTLTGSATVTINALPNAPTIATIQPSCAIPTATITISGVAGETYSFDSGVFSTTLVYSGLAQGSSHTISAKNSFGCISPVANITINNLSTKTWNGSWSPPGAPTSDDLVIINANYSASSNGDLNACSMTINLGSKLTIEEEQFVIIQNNLTVNGTLDVLDKGSLVMVNDSGVVTNSGTTNIHRFTTFFKKYDYTYWATPIVSTNIASTFLGWNTSNTYEYLPANFLDINNDGRDDDGNDWSFASTMAPGKGYIIMVPTPISGPFGNNPSEVVFRGKVNNGVQKITSVIPNSSYLIGNPYPSALDAEAFLDYNAGVLDGTLYFWTHNTAIQAANSSNTSLGTGAFAFTSDDYASYNAVGGVGVGSGIASLTGGVIPNGKIASGQGFFASSKVVISGANEIVFNNAMRLSSGEGTLDNTQFFKTRNPKAKTVKAIEKHRIWLDLTNSQGVFKQTLVGYVTDATNDYDSRFDGQRFDGNKFVDFYSINGDKNLTIQGRALPFDENDEVPLGFKSAINGNFTINIDQADGLLVNQPVYLEDKLTNAVFDLKSGNYTFNTVAGTFNDRFVLRYADKVISTNKTLGLDETDANDGIIVLYSNNYKTLIIRNNMKDATVNTITLFNMLGQKITDWDVKDREQTSIQIPIKNVSPEMYIVKVKTTKGETSKKIVIR